MSTIETGSIQLVPDAEVLKQPERPLPELISRTCDMVLDGGDAIDRIVWLKRSRLAGAVGLAGTGAAGFQAGMLDINVSSIVLEGLGSTAAVATTPLANKLQRRKIEPILEAFRDVSRQLDGDAVEVYRVKGRRKQQVLSAVWEPTLERIESQESYAAAAIELQESLQDTRIKTIAIPESAIKATSVKPAETTRTVSRQAWLKQTKGRSIEDIANQKDPLVVFTRDEFAEYTEQLRAPKENPLEIYMGLLRGLQPRHPSLRMYDAYLRGGSQNVARVARSLKRVVDSRLQDVDVAPRHHVNGIRSKQKIQIRGQVDISENKQLGGTLRWLSTSGLSTGERTKLLDYVGTSLNDLAELPQMIRSLPRHKAIELCEISAWLAAHEAVQVSVGRATTLHPHDSVRPERVPIEAATSVRGMQRRIANRVLGRQPKSDAHEQTGISLRGNRWRKFGRTALTMTATFVLGLGVAKGTDAYLGNYYDKHINPLYEKAPDDWLSNPGAKRKVDEEIDKALRAPEIIIPHQVSIASFRLEDGLQSVIERFLRHNPQAAESLRDKVPEKIRKIAEERMDQQNDSLVGNVTRGKNKPVWFIESINGMDSEGYWTNETSNWLGGNVIEPGLKWYNRSARFDAGDFDTKRRSGRQRDADFEAWLKSMSEAPYLPVEPIFHDNDPALKVQKMVTMWAESKDSSFSTDAYDGFFGDGDDGKLESFTAIDIPVLDGTRPIAASLDGRPLKAIRLRSGAYTLLMRDYKEDVLQTSKGNHLTYWLVPQPKQDIRAVGPIINLNKEDRHRAIALAPELEAWEKYIPGISTLTPEERLLAQERYIAGTFKYKLDPLDNVGALKNSHLYMESVLEDAEANCNVANTALAISNPELVNYVTGFHNSNTTQQEADNALYLSTGEAHAWTVDRQGEIYDATPPGNNPEDKEHFTETSTEKFKSPDQEAREKVYKYIGGGVLGLMLAGGFLTRRRIQKRARSVKRNVAKISLAAIDMRDQQVAYEVLNESVYGKDSPVEKRFEKAVARSADANLDATKEKWESFSRAHTKKGVKHHVHPSDDRQTRRAILWGKRLHRLYVAAQPEST